MAQELRKANLADPLATKFWSPCMARDFTYPALKPSFSTQSAETGLSLQVRRRCFSNGQEQTLLEMRDIARWHYYLGRCLCPKVIGGQVRM